MKDNLCWKCQFETGTFLHCIWECSLVKPLWKKVIDIISCWYGSTISLTPPTVFTIGEKSQLPNVSKRVLSVIMVSITMASWIILRHWKTVKAPELKDWMSAMIEMASYESMLNRVNGVKGDGWNSACRNL